MNPSHAVTFGKVLAEWLGEGLHPDPKAQARADVCSGRLSGHKCPHNYLGGWIVPEKIANTVKAWIEAKEHLDLSLEKEEELGHCEICQCRLNLKVFVPLPTILKHTPAPTLSDFRDKAPWCWLNTEQK